ncbi:MAG: cell division ATP-binding protein FtsE [Myxococcota bacterium]
MIQFSNVSKYYGKNTALRDVNFTVSKGEFCYITGPSGAGKSTMLKLLYGAIPPSSGAIKIGDYDLSSLSRNNMPYLRRNIGVVFQDFKLIPSRTVFENISLALEVIGTPRKVIERQISTVLRVVQLNGKEHMLPQALSGGEQQRVAVARAIVNDPAILLADEPTGNLDGAMAIDVMKILQTINLRGTTVLVATHDVALMERFPYRKLYFRNGRLETA